MALGRSAPMLMSASPDRGGGDGAGAGRTQRAAGSSATIAKFRSTDSGAALTACAAVTRAREAAPIPARSDADRPCTGRLGGAAAAGRRRHFFFAELLLADRRRTLELGRPAPMLTSASPDRAAAMVPAPIERSELPGHRQQIGKSAALSVRRSPSLAQRCGAAARKDQRNLAAFPAAVTRARIIGETRRLLTNRPGSSFSTKRPIPTNVYASAIGLCKDLSDCEDKVLGLPDS